MGNGKVKGKTKRKRKGEESGKEKGKSRKRECMKLGVERGKREGRGMEKERVISENKEEEEKTIDEKKKTKKTDALIHIQENVGYNVVDGTGKIAEDEDARLQQVNLKGNMPMEDSDFNCVDIYKQLAFQHPLLKNHKIQLYPSFSKNSRKIRSSYVGKGCPPGKVPVQRIKRNHMRSENFRKASIAKFHQLSNGYYPGHHFCTLDTVGNTTYRGAGSFITLYNPPVQISQFSMALTWVANGPPSELNAIAIGWAVHPSLYNDTFTRVTAYWTTDGYQKTGCYNAMCPGFVQVNREHYLGDGFEKTSIIGGRQYAMNFTVKQDKSTGHWWLLISRNTSLDHIIGYWPKEIFSHLANGASMVSYGGTTRASPNGISPPMGSGLFATTKFGRACSFMRIRIINSMYQETDIRHIDMKTNCGTRPNCYTLLYEGYKKFMIPKGHYFNFGGPGGKCDA
ncbi:hypothetical protein L6164_013565 [Bauhinia variegata]|uniref:Uncharacterized protein n=1 Tax=Bauhinia variegata TaxID=167791 RepID=A0ACB9NEF8_BAUVA|nr:hypothetical protein L6164_013565 [Bauhinia variegata]